MVHGVALLSISIAELAGEERTKEAQPAVLSTVKDRPTDGWRHVSEAIIRRPDTHMQKRKNVSQRFDNGRNCSVKGMRCSRGRLFVMFSLLHCLNPFKNQSFAQNTAK
jgi:hypothetical protein